jgi:phospholipase/carboxylesterase
MENLKTITIASGENPQYSFIFLHGLGADANDFVPFVDELSLPNDIAIRFVFPNAPMLPVTINNGMKMSAWYDILGLDRMSKQDETGIKQSEQAIQQCIDYELEQGIAADHIFLGGFSQGGAMALHTGLRYSQKLAGIIALSTYLPLADLVAAERHATNHDTPIFYAHGTFDPVIPLELAELSLDELQNHQYPIEWHAYPMMHSVCQEEIDDLSLWLSQKMLA